MSSPIQIRVRTSLQQLWMGNEHWDCPLLLDDCPDLKVFFRRSRNLSLNHIKRNYFEDSKLPVHKRLHVFSDASEKAIAYVEILHRVFSDNSVSLNFILGNARVAPIKRITSPNLEVMAATNKAKISRFIIEEENFSLISTTYWIESTTVLSEINSSESSHKIFIANRLSIIRSTLTVSQWRYVPTALNPADDGTRGIPVTTFETWWPKGTDFFLHNPETRQERPKIALERPTTCFLLGPTDTIVSFQNFSQWTRLRRTVASCCFLLDKHGRIKFGLGVTYESVQLDLNGDSKNFVSGKNLCLDKTKASFSYLTKIIVLSIFLQ